MAEKDMIGFDPLAWMNDEADKAEEQPKEQLVSKQVAIDQIDPPVSEPLAPPVVEKMVIEPESVEEVVVAPVIASEVEQTDDSKVTLDATLNIQNVSHLYEQLLVLLDKQDKIEIDASEVASIDTATLQLLIVLKQSAIKLQKEIIFDFPSDKFIESAELLGLAEMLEVDQAAAGFF